MKLKGNLQVSGTTEGITFTDESVSYARQPKLTFGGGDFYLSGDGGGNAKVQLKHPGPAGSNTNVQYNANGEFGGDSAFTYNEATDTLSAPDGVFTSSLTVGTSLAVSYSVVTIGQAGSAPELTLEATGGTNEGGQLNLMGAAANVDWSVDNFTGDLRFFESGNVRVQIHSGADPTARLDVTGKIKFGGTNTTGSGSAALGANCPATTAGAPYTWIEAIAADGSTVYIPAWK